MFMRSISKIASRAFSPISTNPLFISSAVQLRRFSNLTENPKQPEVILDTLPTELVPHKTVDYSVILPPNYSEIRDTIPLVLYLHGGGGSRDELVQAVDLLSDDYQGEDAVPHIYASISGNSDMYLDFFDKSTMWETFLMKEFLPFICDKYNCGGERKLQYVLGISMGGAGSLRLAFRYPEQFAAVAACEPAIDAALKPSELDERNLWIAFQNSERLSHMNFDSMFGGIPPKYNDRYYKQNNQCTLANDNAKAIIDAGLKIYIECGDQDSLMLHDGTELLHRILWNQKIEHEYRSFHGADHVGSSLLPRSKQQHGWLMKIMKETVNPPDPAANDPTEEEMKWIEWLINDAASGKEMVGTPIDMFSDKMITAMQLSVSDEVKQCLGKPTDGPSHIGEYKWRSGK